MLIYNYTTTLLHYYTATLLHYYTILLYIPPVAQTELDALAVENTLLLLYTMYTVYYTTIYLRPPDAPSPIAQAEIDVLAMKNILLLLYRTTKYYMCYATYTILQNYSTLLLIPPHIG